MHFMEDKLDHPIKFNIKIPYRCLRIESRPTKLYKIDENLQKLNKKIQK